MRPLAPILFLLLVTASACATGSPGAGEPAYNVRGTYGGRFVFDGQRFGASLQLQSDGPGRVRGAFRVGDPIAIEGPASGVLMDEYLRVEVEYRSPEGCDGTIVGILTVEPGGDVIAGPVTVTDCRGPVAGQMDFRRVERDPRPGSNRTGSP